MTEAIGTKDALSSRELTLRRDQRNSATSTSPRGFEKKQAVFNKAVVTKGKRHVETQIDLLVPFGWFAVHCHRL